LLNPDRECAHAPLVVGIASPIQHR
jgi:hypothetical protein